MSIAFGIYAPSGFATEPDAVARAAERLRQMGHRVVVDTAATTRSQRFAGSDDERLAAIMRMCARDDVDVMLAVRGGYGWTRLLDRLDYATIARAGKRWIGHSDFTAFQLAALSMTGMKTFAGPMASFDFGAAAPSMYTLDHCFALLEAREHAFDCLLDGPDLDVEGVLWGGNLALCASLVGTRYLPWIDGGILFLEDVAEHPYRVERMLYQLHYAGVLARQRAVLLGAFTEYTLNANDGGYDFEEMVAQMRRVTDVPICTGLPFGHIRDKVTLPVGGRARVSLRAGAAHVALSDYT
ncbi:MAG: LD-carboxypeptidase [Betaproteobacteria bacterium]